MHHQRKVNKNISNDLNFKAIILIGTFQMLALIPGVSRAGITITAARFLKFNRFDSGKISFLLSIPALAGASFFGLKDAFSQSIQFNYLLIAATGLSFIFSYLIVKFFLMIRRPPRSTRKESSAASDVYKRQTLL